jgi:hypothetical protein
MSNGAPIAPGRRLPRRCFLELSASAGGLLAAFRAERLSGPAGSVVRQRIGALADAS